MPRPAAVASDQLQPRVTRATRSNPWSKEADLPDVVLEHHGRMDGIAHARAWGGEEDGLGTVGVGERHGQDGGQVWTKRSYTR